MNNQGWGLRIMLFFCACFIIILVMSSAALEKGFKESKPKNNKEQIESYYTLEVKMVNAAKNYIQNNYKDIKNINLHISVTKLINDRYIAPIKDPYTKKECRGYVEFNKENNQINYEPYLKCEDKYVTNGYEMKYE